MLRGWPDAWVGADLALKEQWRWPRLAVPVVAALKDLGVVIGGGAPPTFWKGFPGPRGQPDLTNAPNKKTARLPSGTQYTARALIQKPLRLGQGPWASVGFQNVGVGFLGFPAGFPTPFWPYFRVCVSVAVLPSTKTSLYGYGVHR